MTDRVPGAPGQYSAVIAKEELQKLQGGNAFTITLTRDDCPVQEGTPYSKAAVLPDTLAQKLCPNIQDPAPKDAFASLYAGLSEKADGPQQKKGTMIVCNNSAFAPIKNLRVFGKTVQNGIPTPENPAAMESVGDNGSITVNITGKNLLGGTALESILLEKGAVKQNDGTVRFSPGNITGGVRLFENFQPNTIYTIVLSGRNDLGKAANLAVWYTDGYFELLRFPTAQTDGIAYYRTLSGRSIETLGIYPELGETYLYCDQCGIFEGSIAEADYETYQGQQLPVHISSKGLRGIPIPAEGPEVSGQYYVPSQGNYTDENGQQWVCDEIDFSRGVYIQRIGECVIDGTVKPRVFTDSPLGGKVMNWSYSTLGIDGSKDIAVGPTSRALSVKLCDCLQPQYKRDSVITNLRSGFWGFTTSTALDKLLVINLGDFADVDAAMAYLQQHPITFYYVLATPFEASLEDTQSFDVLYTNAPYTVVSNDADAPMEFAYYASASAVPMLYEIKDSGKLLAIDRYGCVSVQNPADVVNPIQMITWEDED